MIDFWHMQMSAEEFQGAMKSQISKYAIRLGRKDDKVSELKKLRTMQDDTDKSWSRSNDKTRRKTK